MKYTRFNLGFLLLLVTAFSCRTSYQPTAVQYHDYRIGTTRPASESLNQLLKPYSDSVNRNMNDVIAVAGMALEKRQPEGTLNNVLADAMLIMAREKYATAIDASFINFGGIRLPSIAAGNISRGKIYELAPFDNIIVVLQLKGNVLQDFLNLIAARGGWPCAGIRYQLKNKQAVNVVIGGSSLDMDKTYTVALLDYVANGGDDAAMLRSIPQQNNGYLFREAVLDYFSRQQAQGKAITATLEKRVSNAE